MKKQHKHASFVQIMSTILSAAGRKPVRTRILRVAEAITKQGVEEQLRIMRVIDAHYAQLREGNEWAQHGLMDLMAMRPHVFIHLLEPAKPAEKSEGTTQKIQN